MNWDWLAGFIDGDGTLTFWRYKTRAGNRSMMPYLLIAQKDRGILEDIREFLGLTGACCANVREAHNVQYPGNFRLDIQGQQLLPILKQLEPRLQLKKRQAQLLIEFIELRQSSRRNAPIPPECYELDYEMRKLNARGKSGAHNILMRMEQDAKYKADKDSTIS